MPTPLLILEEGLYLLLTQNASITALTGPNGIYLNSVPEDAHDPCMCIQKISSAPDSTNDGPSGLNIRRYQFSFYSTSYPNAVRLSETTRQAIDGFTGHLPNGQRVFNIIRDNEIDGFNDQSGSQRTITDYFIHFAE